MGIAPAVGAAASAIGTIGALSAQSRQAAAQKAAIESNRLAAQQSYELARRRFQYTAESSAKMFEREREILQFANEQAQRQFRAEQIGQGIQESQANLQRVQANTGLDNQVSQLLAGAAQVEGQAALANVQRLGQGMGVVGQLANNNEVFAQRATAMSTGNPSIDAYRQLSLLDAVSMLQVMEEAAATDTRVAGFQGTALRNNAATTGKYKDIVNQFLATQQQGRQVVNNAINQVYPSLLDLQAQRNLAALEAANYARQAESALAQESAALQLINANRMADAQRASVAGPNYLGAIANIGASVAPVIAAYNMQQQQQQPSYQFSSNWMFNPSNQQFTAPNTQFASPTRVQFPTLLDVPTEIPVYG